MARIKFKSHLVKKKYILYNSNVSTTLFSYTVDFLTIYVLCICTYILPVGNTDKRAFTVE